MVGHLILDQGNGGSSPSLATKSRKDIMDKYVITFTSPYMATKEKVIEARTDFAAIDESQHMVDTQDDLEHYRVTSVVKMAL
jgi:hypothetical protein